MAVYNGARHIREQLDSLLRQTHLPVELVIGDDGSTDETEAIIADFATAAPFEVRYIRNESRLGYADNFMHAASLCRGELISFCDQDDIWKPNKIAKCVQEFLNPEVHFCVHSATLFGDSIRGQIRIPDFKDRQIAKPLRYYPLEGSIGFTMVFRRDLLEVVGSEERPSIYSPEVQLSHDQWLWFLGTIFGSSVTLPDSLADYRQHDSNTTGPRVKAASQVVKDNLSVRDYSVRAVQELRAAEFLAKVAAKGGRWEPYARSGAEFLRRCSDINFDRADLYRSESSFLQRFALFSKLLTRGTYSIGQKAAWLGWRALVKDLLIGVLRVGSR